MEGMRTPAAINICNQEGTDRAGGRDRRLADFPFLRHTDADPAQPRDLTRIKAATLPQGHSVPTHAGCRHSTVRGN